MEGFETVWRRFYPAFQPVGWMMRGDGAEHWLRFHSLPKSKRYAETGEERQILLTRQNRIAREVLGEGKPCWLAQSWWNAAAHSDAAAENVSPPPIALAFGATFVHHFTVNDGEDDHVWTVQAARSHWRSHAFDPLLLEIAESSAPRALWLNEDNGAVFAPYDGGVDLFLPDRSAVNHLRSLFADWLSPHPLGL